MMDGVSREQALPKTHSQTVFKSMNNESNFCNHPCGNGNSSEIDIDPFKHRLTMTTLEWLRTYVLAILLIPIRVVLILVTLLLADIVASVALFNLSEELKTEKPIAPYWRKLAQKIAAFLGRTSVRFCGFSVTVKGKMASAEEAPILVAAPHSGFFDAFVLFWSKTPYLVSREENRKLPVLGKCIELSQSINVKREDPNSRQCTVEEIIRRTNLNNHPDPA
jgi:lysophosphatidylcholine acyltransferase/lyso-PAF acetyltransferase